LSTYVIFLLISGIDLTLNGVSYTNNSIVNITDIGTGSAALNCTTTLPKCCFSHQGGGWFLPNGNVINNSESLPYYRRRAEKPGAILLHRNPEGTTTGVFHCDVPAASDIPNTTVIQSLYMGIYTITTGEFFALSGCLVICRRYLAVHFRQGEYISSVCVIDTLNSI